MDEYSSRSLLQKTKSGPFIVDHQFTSEDCMVFHKVDQPRYMLQPPASFSQVVPGGMYACGMPTRVEEEKVTAQVGGDVAYFNLLRRTTMTVEDFMATGSVGCQSKKISTSKVSTHGGMTVTVTKKLVEKKC